MRCWYCRLYLDPSPGAPEHKMAVISMIKTAWWGSSQCAETKMWVKMG